MVMRYTLWYALIPYGIHNTLWYTLIPYGIHNTLWYTIWYTRLYRSKTLNPTHLFHLYSMYYMLFYVYIIC